MILQCGRLALLQRCCALLLAFHNSDASTVDFVSATALSTTSAMA
jgi:hypothetical protein